MIMYPKYPCSFGYDPKNPPPLWIIWINYLFWILVKKQNISFRIKNPDLNFSKETHLCSASTGVSQSNFSSSHTSEKVSANWTEFCKKCISLRSRIPIFLTICRKFHLLVHPRENNFLTVLPIFRRQH